MNKSTKDDYIKRSAARHAVLHQSGDAARAAIAEIPSEPVVSKEEYDKLLQQLPKHGVWEQSEYPGFVRCSVCKDCFIEANWVKSGKWQACPKCASILATPHVTAEKERE